jgi:hypothetical protein
MPSCACGGACRAWIGHYHRFWSEQLVAMDALVTGTAGEASAEEGASS